MDAQPHGPLAKEMCAKEDHEEPKRALQPCGKLTIGQQCHQHGDGHFDQHRVGDPEAEITSQLTLLQINTSERPKYSQCHIHHAILLEAARA